MRCTYLLSLLCLTLPQALTAQEGNWPSFRGPRASGVDDSQPLAEGFDVPSGKNIAWKTPIPGLSHSSPVIWGSKLFVTSALREAGPAELSSLYGSPNYGAGDSVPDEGPVRFQLYCLDKHSGKILWQVDAKRGVPLTKRHPKATHANSTPACDAERVLAFFGSEGLYCYDHAGKLLWQRDFGVLNSAAPGIEDPEGFQWGFASSPVLYEERVLIQCDVENQSFLTVLDANTGKELWRVEREENSTWSTPAILPAGAGGKPQVVVNGYQHIGGYDLATGEEVWKLVGGGDVPVPTPVMGQGKIFITSAHGPMAPIYAIDDQARGLLSMDAKESEHMLWSHRRKGIYMQTPLVYGEELYCCSDGGILSVFDLSTGEQLYRERLSAGTGFSGSAVAADGKLYFSGENGEVFIVGAGLDYELLGRGDLGENHLATPAISEGRLYFHTLHHVVAVGP